MTFSRDPSHGRAKTWTDPPGQLVHQSAAFASPCCETRGINVVAHGSEEALGAPTPGSASSGAPTARFQARQRHQAAGKLACYRPSAESADVDRDRACSDRSGKPFPVLAPKTAQTQPVSHPPCALRKTNDFRTPVLRVLPRGASHPPCEFLAVTLEQEPLAPFLKPDRSIGLFGFSRGAVCVDPRTRSADNGVGWSRCLFHFQVFAVVLDLR